jgi:hypothetical protein
VAAPAPGRRLVGEAEFDRPAYGLAADRRQVGRRLHHHRAEAALEDVASDAVAAVEGLRIAAVELAHAARQRRPAGLHHQVVAVRQQAVGQAAPVEARADLAQNLQEKLGILRVAEHQLAAVPEGGDVIGRAGQLEAKGPCHDRSLAPGCATSKT